MTVLHYKIMCKIVLCYLFNIIVFYVFVNY